MNNLVCSSCHRPLGRVHKDNNVVCHFCETPLIKTSRNQETKEDERYMYCPNKFCGYPVKNPKYGDECPKCKTKILG